MSVDLEIEADVQLGAVALTAGAEKRKTADRDARLQRQQPRALKFPTSLTLSASTGTLAFPACPAGRTWDVRRLTMTGGDPTSPPTATAVYLFCGGSAGDLSGASFVQDMLTPNQTAFFSRHQLTLSFPELVYLRIVGGTSGQVWHAQLQVVETALGSLEAYAL